MATIALLAGGFTWTLLEYLLHRFVFHERRLGAELAREHLEHHAKVDWFAPMARKALLAAVILPLLTLLAVPLLGWGAGWTYTSGVVGGWLAYEALHRAIHVWAPRSAYGRFVWKHHLFHHFGDPRRNHGVSSPVWDLVFGTYTRVTTLSVPARAARKLPWLLEGDVVPERLAGTHVVRA